MADYPIDYGKEETMRRYMDERQRAEAYLTIVVYALVFWCLLGALCSVVEMFFQYRRVRQEERRRVRQEERRRVRQEERRRERHQMMRQGLHEE